MDAYVFFAVLMAALFHALWNAGLKVRISPGIAITLMSVVAGVVAVPLPFIFGLPAPASWPYLAASLAIHLFYYIALAEAYRTGDLGQVYPIARGSAPLMTAVGSALLLGEALGWLGWSGVVVLTSGVALLSLRGGHALRAVDGRSIGFAFATAATIAAYTLVDGVGGRLSGNAHAYAVMLFVLDGLMMAVYGLVRQRSEIVSAFSAGWMLIIGGGVLSLVSYWIAIWAMSVAPIALVAAVRETSVLFAALLGVLLLKEPMIPVRIAAAALVLTGLVLIRLH
jgi:drug/metabolite transporter (DMT)-like permease